VRPRRPAALALIAALALGLTAGACGSTGKSPGAGSVATNAPIPASLLRGLRHIGRGPRFLPPVTGRPTGACASRPGPEEAHLELFGANQVVLIAAGVGHRGGCYGNAVTISDAGVVHFRPGATLAEVFRAWGEPLSADQMASFRGPVRYYVAGRRVHRVPALTEHAEIVIEVGPYVPPHARFSFPEGL
jgi:hypothetical protein